MWVITAIRAAHTGITYDEAYSYTHLSDFSLANNHPLNSLLVYIFTDFIGVRYNEFLIRLPNLLFYVLYLSIAIKFGARFENRYLVFSLLAFNYCLSEFFGLGRGYGIAAALILTGAYIYSAHRSNLQSPLLVIYIFLAACACNYSLLVFLGSYVIYIFCFDIGFSNLVVFLKRNWFHLALQMLAALVMAWAFLHVTQDGKPLIGLRDSFFNAVIMGYVKMFLTDPLRSKIMAFGLLLFVFTAIVVLKESLLKKPFTIMLAINFGLTYILAEIANRPLPTERVLLPLWPILALSMAEIYDAFRSRMKAASRANVFYLAANLVAILLLVHFIKSVNIGYTTNWKDNYPIREKVYMAAMTHTKIEYIQGDPPIGFYRDKIKYEYGIDIDNNP